MIDCLMAYGKGFGVKALNVEDAYLTITPPTHTILDSNNQIVSEINLTSYNWRYHTALDVS